MNEPTRSYEKIRYEVYDGVARITLDDPDTRNALSDQLLSELIGALEEARDDYAVRVVVLASSHEKVFSAGGNLAAFGGESGTVEKFTGAGLFVDCFKLLGELGKPSLVAAKGHVLAGSLGLALACDLIIASEDATFGTPEITVGLFPFMIMALIYRNVGRKKTNEMLLLGERHLLAPGQPGNPRGVDMPLAEALDYLRAQLAIELSTEDAIEGVKAFFEKRDPEWKGR